MSFCSREQVRVQLSRLTALKGDRGEPGPQGLKGERGVPGFVVSASEPEDPEVGVWIDPSGDAELGEVASEETRGCVRIGKYLRMNGDVLTLDIELLRQELGTALPDTPEEISLAVDAQGGAALTGAALAVDEAGEATLTGAALAVDTDGNATIG